MGPNRVYIDGVVIGDRLRHLDEAKVDSLAESMAAIGLQHPISIYAPTDDDINLIAGLHRLKAVEKLGWEEIECVFLDLPEIDRQLWEIDENLMRSDLTQLERADHLQKRREIWEARGGRIVATLGSLSRAP